MKQEKQCRCFGRDMWLVSVLLQETGKIGLAWFRSVNILPS